MCTKVTPANVSTAAWNRYPGAASWSMSKKQHYLLSVAEICDCLLPALSRVGNQESQESRKAGEQNPQLRSCYVFRWRLLLQNSWLYHYEYVPSQCISDFNVSQSHLDILLKCRSSRFGWGLIVCIPEKLSSGDATSPHTMLWVVSSELFLLRSLKSQSHRREYPKV